MKMKTEKNVLMNLHYGRKHNISKLGFFLLFLIIIFSFNLLSTNALLVSKIEIKNDTFLVSKPFFVIQFPQEYKIPYYEIYVNDFKFKSNDLTFYIPVNSTEVDLKVVDLITRDVILEKKISFCNHDGICQDYEFDSCSDCKNQEYEITYLRSQLSKKIDQIKPKKQSIPEYYFYLSIAVLIFILFVLYSVLYLNKRHKRGNIAVHVLILSIIGLIFLFISHATFTSGIGNMSKNVNKVFTKAKKLEICNRLYQQYQNDKQVLSILFYGCNDCTCTFEGTKISCINFCGEFVNQFEVKPVNLNKKAFTVELPNTQA